MTQDLFPVLISSVVGVMIFALGYFGRELRDLRKTTSNDIKHLIEDVGKIKGKLGIDD